MKIVVALAAALTAAGATAQIRSITDPTAYRPDSPPTKPKAKPVAEESPRESAPAVTSPAIAPGQAKAATATTEALNLICGGGGTANKANVASIYGSSSASGMVGTSPISMNGSSSGTIITQRQQGFADQVDVRLFTGDDRIRLPRTMLPPIHGGNDGWFKLKNVVVTDRAITASAGVNFINSPKVHIDRLTGTISINGKAGTYTGQCEAVDPNAQRKF